jgi:hypothetical protein
MSATERRPNLGLVAHWLLALLLVSPGPASAGDVPFGDTSIEDTSQVVALGDVEPDGDPARSNQTPARIRASSRRSLGTAC